VREEQGWERESERARGREGGALIFENSIRHRAERIP
jgi:hypothetical protein